MATVRFLFFVLVLWRTRLVCSAVGRFVDGLLWVGVERFLCRLLLLRVVTTALWWPLFCRGGCWGDGLCWGWFSSFTFGQNRLIILRFVGRVTARELI
jgi:hypothetical protein